MHTNQLISTRFIATLTMDMLKINISEEQQLRFWKDHFNVTSGRLRKAIKEAGTSVKAVRDYLHTCLLA